jgi:hypothetical protein
MSLRGLFEISGGTKVVLGITFSVAILTVLFAFFYYRSLNLAEDPRVSQARILMAEYDRLSGGPDSYARFHLLDSAEAIYRSLPDYETSFEIGVIFNNKCSGMLMMALYDTTVSSGVKNDLLELSLDYCDSSVSVYNRWGSEWGVLSDEATASKLELYMRHDDPVFEGRNFNRIFRRRVRNIALARIETPRRLSVSYTNRAMVYRHLMMQDSALLYYEKALSLWKENRTAKSNMNVLLGGEPVKPGLIESLFPPDRNKSPQQEPGKGF